MTAASVQGGRIPRLPDDYTRAAAAQRLDFLNEATGTRPRHLGRYGMDPADLAGNIENFVGAAQVPVGVAGPLLIDGEHARGEFYVPLATTEGTLVASYNRGMKLLDRAGGVRTTVMDDVMQRAPAFGFDSAREARAFGAWVTTHFGAIKDAAEATTHTGHLRDVEQFTWAATARARSASSPRSSRPRCCAARSRWAPRSSRRSGWTHTSDSAGTGHE